MKEPEYWRVVAGETGERSLSQKGAKLGLPSPVRSHSERDPTRLPLRGRLHEELPRRR